METILEWHSPEHHFDRKANDWYWILGIVCVAAAVLAFYFDNFLFGIFVEFVVEFIVGPDFRCFGFGIRDRNFLSCAGILPTMEP